MAGTQGGVEGGECAQARGERGRRRVTRYRGGGWSRRPRPSPLLRWPRRGGGGRRGCGVSGGGTGTSGR